MTSFAQIEPHVSPDRLYPENAAFMARTDLHQTRMLGYQPLNIDAVTTTLLGILGTMPTVRHRSGATDEILTFLRDAGLSVTEDMHVYDSGQQAEAIADDLVQKGKRLIWPYPLREGRFPDAAHLVAPDLWQKLNSKECMADLVPTGALPVRRVLPTTQLSPDLPERPAYLKAAGQAATGWGYAVRYVVSDADVVAARDEFATQDVERVIIEQAVDVTACWCANLSVVDAGTTYLGAAEQVFSAPARQSGSVIDPAVAFPEHGIALALQIAKSAARQGFRGICGIDIGLTRDGQLVAFDPNFRFNSSTAQVLLHPAAAARSSLAVSVSFSGQSTRTISDIIGQVSGPVADGWFIPTRLLDQAYLPAAGGTSLCTGFVLGRTRAEAQENAATLAACLA